MPSNRFTIFDVLEKKGYFERNPANPTSRDPTDGHSLYTGPVQYPKMLYHPEGEEQIIVPAEVLQTPLGPKLVGEQRQLVNRIVQNEAEDAEAKAEGWHDHPSKALRRRVELHIEANPHLSEGERQKLLKTIPTISSDARIRELENELARLTGQLEAEAAQKAEDQKVQPTVQPKPAGSNQKIPAAAPNPAGNNQLASL